MHNSWGQLFKPRKRTGKYVKEHQEPQAEYMRICSDNHFQIYESTEASFTIIMKYIQYMHTFLTSSGLNITYRFHMWENKQFFEYILKLGKK